eukprot:5940791-Pyramimonas_sp.AAC.1
MEGWRLPKTLLFNSDFSTALTAFDANTLCRPTSLWTDFPMTVVTLASFRKLLFRRVEKEGQVEAAEPASQACAA